MLGGLSAVSAATSDLYMLLNYGREAQLSDAALRGVLHLELAVLLLVWAGFVACWRKRRGLQAVAFSVSPRLRVTPCLRLRGGGGLAESFNNAQRGDSQLARAGQWTALLSWALPMYFLHQPNEVAGQTCDQDCIASCRVGRKVIVVIATVSALFTLQVSYGRQGRAADNSVNLGIRVLRSVFSLASGKLLPCWNHRLLWDMSPASSIIKCFVHGVLSNVLLPVGPREALIDAVAGTVGMSHVMVNRSGSSSVVLHWTSVWLPQMLLHSLELLYAYIVESGRLKTFLHSARRTHVD
eukprot:jgi/Tetstr1/424278/TSEL_014846.t1